MAARTVTLLALAVACSSKHDREPPAAPPPSPPAVPAAPPRPVALSEAWWAALPELPAGTFDVSIVIAAFDGPPEAEWSWLAAAACDENDVFALPTQIQPHTREGLRCGRALFEHLPAGATAYVLDVNRPAHDSPKPLFVVPTTYVDLPAVEPLVVGFHRETLGGVPVLCRPFDPGPESCAERRGPYDKALAVVDGKVIAGSYVALAELLAWPARDRVLALLGELPARTLELDLLPHGATWTIGPRRWLPYSGSEADAFADVVRTQARGVVHDVGWGIGTGSITLVPRCSTPACPERAALAAALRTYQQAWAAEAPKRMRDLMAEDPGPETECMRPLEAAMVAQATHAQVTAQNLVELAFSLPPDQLAKLRCKTLDAKRDADGIARVRAAI